MYDQLPTPDKSTDDYRDPLGYEAAWVKEGLEEIQGAGRAFKDQYLVFRAIDNSDGWDMEYMHESAAIASMASEIVAMVANFRALLAGLEASSEEIAGLVNEFNDFTQSNIFKAIAAHHLITDVMSGGSPGPEDHVELLGSEEVSAEVEAALRVAQASDWARDQEPLRLMRDAHVEEILNTDKEQ